MTRIKVTCIGGHEEILTLHTNLGPYAVYLAEILTGRSTLIAKPRPSMIGWCGYRIVSVSGGVPCGCPLTCEVVK